MITYGLILDKDLTQLRHLHAMALTFKTHFIRTVDAMEEKHNAERVRLVTVKKSYSKMVKSLGKNVVDRQLHISEAQAKRHHFVRYPDVYKPVFDDSLQLVDIASYSEEGKLIAQGTKPSTLNADSSLY